EVACGKRDAEKPGCRQQRRKDRQSAHQRDRTLVRLAPTGRIDQTKGRGYLRKDSNRQGRDGQGRNETEYIDGVGLHCPNLAFLNKRVYLFVTPARFPQKRGERWVLS